MDSSDSSLSPVNSIIILEGDARGILDGLSENENAAKAAEFLQVFLESLPPDGKRVLSQDIVNHSTSDDLCRLYLSLYSGLLVPLKINRGRTPVPTASPIPEVVQDSASLAALLETYSPGKRETALRTLCLRRDGQSCVVTGDYNTTSYDKFSPEEQEQKQQQNQGFSISQCEVAHILPFSLSSNQSSQNEPRALMWTYIHRYFPSTQGVIHNNLNAVINTITLQTDIHIEFDRFRFALEPRGEENSYRCVSYVNPLWRFRQVDGKIIDLHNHGTNLPLPGRAILQLHAAIARVMHLTGAGEVIDRVLQDREEIHVLAQDGSTDVVDLVQMLTVY